MHLCVWPQSHGYQFAAEVPDSAPKMPHQHVQHVILHQTVNICTLSCVLWMCQASTHFCSACCSAFVVANETVCGLSQVRSIMGQVRPDRQTLLFTATMPTKVDNLVRDCLTTPVRITVGEVGAANQDIQQASTENLQCSTSSLLSHAFLLDISMHEALSCTHCLTGTDTAHWHEGTRY